MEACPLITLTTDFGAGSCFVGIMKGVIYSFNPRARVVDLAHTISFGNVKEAAFVVSKSWMFFPPDSIHVVVVDPGVGTKRKIIALQKRKTVFVAPDNGVLSYVYEDGDRVYALSDDTFFLKPVSRTFHGRDVFAPVASLLSLGVPLISLGERTNTLELIPKPKIEVRDGEIAGEVIFADSFGNLVTSIEERCIRGKRVKEMWLGEKRVYGPVSSFEEGKGKGLCAIVDSFGHLEVFVYLGSALEVSGYSGEPFRVFLD